MTSIRGEQEREMYNTECLREAVSTSETSEERKSKKKKKKKKRQKEQHYTAHPLDFKRRVIFLWSD